MDDPRGGYNVDGETARVRRRVGVGGDLASGVQDRARNLDPEPEKR